MTILLKSKDIICFSPSDWWGMNPSCTTHLMKYFSRDNRVIYVNPFSSDIIGSIGTTEKRRGLWGRILRKLKSLAKICVKINDSLYIVSPFFFPFQGIGWIDAVNNFLISLQLLVLFRFLSVRKPIVWVENLRAADLFKIIVSDCIVYHVSDLFTDDSYIENQSILVRRENKILSNADLIICVSVALYDRLRTKFHNVSYVPHGVDYELFQNAMTLRSEMKELSGIAHPVAGYFGTLTSHNNIELLEYCAEKLAYVHFVFAGQITGGDYSKLKGLPNVTFLGKLPYDRIPLLCANIDVGLLPWKMDAWIRNCNPLKMFEYMACGKPIVSVPIREAENYPELVRVCETNEAFCEAIETMLRTDTGIQAKARMEVAERNSWAAHVATIGNLISDVLRSKKGVVQYG